MKALKSELAKRVLAQVRPVAGVPFLFEGKWLRAVVVPKPA